MQEHRLITLPASAGFDESRAAALDLDTAASLLLDVLHVGATLADNLRTQVEPRNGFEIDGDTLIGPFALYIVSNERLFLPNHGGKAYATELVPLYLLFGFPAAEPTLINQVGELLLHEIVDDLYSLLKAFLTGAGHMKVERGVLWRQDQ